MMIEKLTDNRVNLSTLPVLDDDGNERIPALDNHSMGTIFEELLRKFNEDYNVTAAGEHFTPRDIVDLMADISFVPVAGLITDNTYLIYDGACGTGGILTKAEERINELAIASGKRINTHIYGQELQPETFATCKADLLIKGEGEEAKNIAFGSTISEDGNANRTFDFMISNPPFGTPWKKDLENWGFKDKKEITDRRFVMGYDYSNELNFVPNIGDPQMLFLANNISKMKDDTAFGSRIVEVHNGSSLFTGNAGGGESNLRKYIIEKDMLEAIIALPEKMFYNTGIATFIWIVTNRKSAQRQGKVQLIDATALKSPLRKNLGEKNSEFTPEIRQQILDLYLRFEENEQCRIFDNNEFGYWEVTIERPLRQQVCVERENIEALVKRSLRMDVKFTEEAVNALAGLGIDATYKDKTPILEEGETILSERFKDERKVKLPKKTGQFTADILLSEAILILCELARQQTIYLNYQAFANKFDTHKRAKQHKLKFDNLSDFFYSLIKTDENADPVIKNGKTVLNPALRDSEQIPLNFPGGMEAFLQKEVYPYYPDAVVKTAKAVIGYELSFTKYFYKPIELRPLADIKADIKAIENETDGLLNLILGE